MKAILVFDVPMLDDGRHLCNECPIWNNEHLFCQYNFNMKAKGCSLKPIPRKEITLERRINGITMNYLELAEAKGRNMVINEILGETE